MMCLESLRTLLAMYDDSYSAAGGFWGDEFVGLDSEKEIDA